MEVQIIRLLNKCTLRKLSNLEDLEKVAWITVLPSLRPHRVNETKEID